LYHQKDYVAEQQQLIGDLLVSLEIRQICFLGYYAQRMNAELGYLQKLRHLRMELHLHLQHQLKLALDIWCEGLGA
jgi:hypothetical protein